MTLACFQLTEMSLQRGQRDLRVRQDAKSGTSLWEPKDHRLWKAQESSETWGNKHQARTWTSECSDLQCAFIEGPISPQ
jgi:hypothetical protein